MADDGFTAAVRTLVRLGYTYDEDAGVWVAPVGKVDPRDVRIATLERALAQSFDTMSDICRRLMDMSMKARDLPGLDYPSAPDPRE